MHGAFILDYLQPIKPLLFPNYINFFSFILGGQFLLPQRANFGKSAILQFQKQDETEGFQCLGHSNWTICIPLIPFCSRNFPTFSSSYWEANSYYPRGLIMGKRDSSNFKIEWDRGDWVPGASKLDHLQPFKPIFFWKFCNFFTFILGSPILLPQRANNGKVKFIQLQNWMRQRGLGTWGIQTGPFVAL